MNEMKTFMWGASSAINLCVTTAPWCQAHDIHIDTRATMAAHMHSTQDGLALQVEQGGHIMLTAHLGYVKEQEYMQCNRTAGRGSCCQSTAQRCSQLA